MKRPSAVSFSALISVVFLYLILLGTTLLFSTQVLTTLGGTTRVSPFFTFFLGGVLPLVLATGLLTQVIKLILELRQGKPGMRFKLRLIFFLNAMTLLATIPQTVLFTRFLTGLIKTEVVQETMVALETGVNLSLDQYAAFLRNLDGLTRQPLRRLWWDDKIPGNQAWNRLQSLMGAPDSLQIYRPGSMENFGLDSLWLEPQPMKDLALDTLHRVNTANGTILRHVFAGGSGTLVMTSTTIPAWMEDTSATLSTARDRFASFMDMGQTIGPTISGLYLIFMLPLLLLAMIAGFFLSDEIIRPLVNLESSMMRIARGDFSVRLAVRKGDEMGFLVNSFNRMMHELGRNRETTKQNERLKAWQDIAQRMAHEIKNPLTPIKLSAQRIVHKYTGNDQGYRSFLVDSVNTIVTEVDNIANMLTEFRNFARLPMPNKEPVKLRALMEEIWAAWDQVEGVRCDMASIPESIILDADPGQVRQVFHNLIKNSMDAMENKGTITIRATVISKAGARICRVQVVDTGPGIPDAHLRKVFTPYWSTKKSGNGLGLSIVEKIIVDHGGEIWCEKTDGHGACFVMELPYG